MKPRVKYDAAKLIRLWTETRMPAAEIAKEIGVSGRKYVRILADKHKLPPRSPRRDCDHQRLVIDMGKFTAMWQAGSSYREIAREFGTSHSVVSEIAKRENLPVRLKKPPLRKRKPKRPVQPEQPRAKISLRIPRAEAAAILDRMRGVSA